MSLKRLRAEPSDAETIAKTQIRRDEAEGKDGPWGVPVEIIWPAWRGTEWRPRRPYDHDQFGM